MRPEIDTIIEAALVEDMPEGDITSESLISTESNSKAIFLAKEDGILAGLDVARRVFFKLDPGIEFLKHTEDGHKIKTGEALAQIEGPSLSLLKGERTALQ